MFKKVVIASAILAVSSSLVFADDVPYLGANLGLNKNSFRFKNPAGINTHLHSSGATGGLFAGYGTTIGQHLYLGGEGFVNTGSINSSTKTTSAGTTDQLRTTYSYGVDFMPGYKFTNTTMAYLKAGLLRTRFKVTQSTGNASTSENNVTGAQLGLGLQKDVTNNVGVRAEFVHTGYNSFTTFGSDIKAANNQVNLGMYYKFD